MKKQIFVIIADSQFSPLCILAVWEAVGLHRSTSSDCLFVFLPAGFSWFLALGSVSRPAADLHPAALLVGDGSLGPLAGQTWPACKERKQKLFLHFLNKIKTQICTNILYLGALKRKTSVCSDWTRKLLARFTKFATCELRLATWCINTFHQSKQMSYLFPKVLQQKKLHCHHLQSVCKQCCKVSPWNRPQI